MRYHIWMHGVILWSFVAVFLQYCWQKKCNSTCAFIASGRALIDAFFVDTLVRVLDEPTVWYSIIAAVFFYREIFGYTTQYTCLRVCFLFALFCFCFILFVIMMMSHVYRPGNDTAAVFLCFLLCFVFLSPFSSHNPAILRDIAERGKNHALRITVILRTTLIDWLYSGFFFAKWL